MLRQLTRSLTLSRNANVLVGTETSDDAGVYQISQDLALVQTVDFFTPIVDDPYVFGQIAAANALSDIYAMGGTPLTALNICAFPTDFPLEPLQKILQGGHDKAHEANTVILGGHSVQDDQLKYGMSITGIIHPQKIYTNKGAKVGDQLILTKPLGTGIITTAIKKRKASSETIEKVCTWMALLNKSAAEAMANFTIHACTDITGFGLTGHSYQLADASHVSLRFYSDRLPLYSEALSFAKKGYLTGANKTNREYVKGMIEFQKKCAEEFEAILFDPQTSGGLLISLPKEEAPSLLNKLHTANLKEAQIIGEVYEGTPSVIQFI
ncbi:MAG: selenide, water dikinase SelD [Deltaproteobacteria bacterium GWA2_38_16]|nr:MAG: selenide, water dikinase SelD [Deltaproteobacteria bacterium GWA2_38_16]OGQ03550.1 MAG: selenide, water dikinase SelD [Deltaproteobacteria bacterium RIFCSPHIGHO2_02_FULL_38_15]OGQ33268.1 MAG: selenide, water dikinase SelD [Deltaproteobacteria bacterium RIFCSPLOWO2_01_FULL_38_9]OGQ59477.1 MAG: selenide, water dikinase SelD [Deltaproteobacteria bacterium RIFCSPLOWO2_12_FULL_38_8]